MSVRMDKVQVYDSWKSQVRFSECDINLTAKLRSWFDYLQEAAALHAEKLGVGLEAMQKEEIFWVLSRIRLVIHEPLKQGTMQEVITWPSGTDKLFCKRQYLVLDGENGTAFGRASSSWLVLDGNTGRPLRPVVLPQKADGWNPEAGSFFDELDKLPLPEIFQLEKSYDIRHSQIDVNRHLNNAEYAGLVEDFVHELTPDRTIREVQINFQHALKAPDRVRIGGMFRPGNPEENKNDSVLLAGWSNVNGELAFQSEVLLAPMPTEEPVNEEKTLADLGKFA